ncbi:MAG: hypothetical protein H5U37_05915 [Caldisericia bacterium]|nr:hypothetical protein [Caldisericia bacterium]
MSFESKEDFFEKLKVLHCLSKEEKDKIFNYILRKEKRKNAILSTIIIFISTLLIILIPFKLSQSDPAFILNESEFIKNLQLNLELTLLNPFFLIQIIYYILIVLGFTIVLVILKRKVLIKGGRGE